ncbi:hypothetical protein DFH07DRAFT_779059 [Mycena maculata]|uniref:FAD-binding domain-containing protein n=1 Tax=Mycena maculata TaxID=230809 RepID=A0AAD7I9U6_9AGAR|nr:hypothetical protein DFH07DRAFT_779059 [Mycena maculata]
MTSPDPKQSNSLKVSIVGAGLGGLAAAIALRRSGAAIGIPPNCQRVLEHFGYNKDNLKSEIEDTRMFERRLAATGILLQQCQLGWVRDLRWHEWRWHDDRMVDLFGQGKPELQRLALGSGDGPPAVLYLASEVRECNTESGALELMLLKVISSSEPMEFLCGRSCYRALIHTSKLENIPELSRLRDGISGVRTIMKVGGPYRLLLVYPCRGGTVLNVVGIFDDPHQDSPDWTGETTRTEVYATFADFHPKFCPLIAALNKRVKKWKLRTVPVLPTWVRGCAALLGDAAHTTLPTLGQGAAMVIEEAAALGALFPHATAHDDVPAHLATYEPLRKA